MIKRFIDIAIACMGIMILSPLLMCLALLVRVKLGSPIFFRQKRPGLLGKPFLICKFRSMTNEMESDKMLLTDNQRLTDIGRFIRNTSLDELPELFNVLKGDMSLIGPRPLLMEYLHLYTKDQFRRHEVRPGITGWAQVNGRNAISWEDKFKLDVWYVDNQSFCLDMKILWMTIIKVFRREGISQEGHATMEKFTGNGGRK